MSKKKETETSAENEIENTTNQVEEKIVPTVEEKAKTDAPQTAEQATANPTQTPSTLYTLQTVMGADGKPTQVYMPIQNGLGAGTALNAMNSATGQPTKKPKHSANYGIVAIISGIVALVCGGLMALLLVLIGADYSSTANGWFIIWVILAFVVMWVVGPIGVVAGGLTSIITAFLAIFKAPKRAISWISFPLSLLMTAGAIILMVYGLGFQNITT